MEQSKEEMIQKVMLISEETDAAIVSYYLDNAEEIILRQLHPFDEDWNTENPPTVPAKYYNLWVRMAVGLLAKRGAEMENMHIENGINRHYSSADVPASMLREITPKAVMW